MIPVASNSLQPSKIEISTSKLVSLLDEARTASILTGVFTGVVMTHSPENQILVSLATLSPETVQMKLKKRWQELPKGIHLSTLIEKKGLKNAFAASGLTEKQTTVVGVLPYQQMLLEASGIFFGQDGALLARNEGLWERYVNDNAISHKGAYIMLNDEDTDSTVIYISPLTGVITQMLNLPS